MVKNATITVSFVDANGQAVEYRMTAAEVDLKMDAGLIERSPKNGYRTFERDPYTDTWQLQAHGYGKDAITRTVKASA